MDLTREKEREKRERGEEREKKSREGKEKEDMIELVFSSMSWPLDSISFSTCLGKDYKVMISGDQTNYHVLKQPETTAWLSGGGGEVVDEEDKFTLDSDMKMINRFHIHTRKEPFLRYPPLTGDTPKPKKGPTLYGYLKTCIVFPLSSTGTRTHRIQEVLSASTAT
jgi:hypothetical protein